MFPGRLPTAETDGVKVAVEFVEGLTWRQIFEAARAGVTDAVRYTNIGFTRAWDGDRVRIHGDGVPDIVILLKDVDICEPSVAGTCFKYFFGSTHALPA